MKSATRTRRAIIALGLGLGIVGATALASPASATQGPMLQYCGASNGGQYNVWSNYSTQQAGSAHATGTVCSMYYVRSHYIVPTTGTGYWDTTIKATYSAVQSPGYPVDQAWHDTDASSPVYTY